MATFDTLLTNVRLATMREAEGYGAIDDAALGIRDGAIAFVGALRDVPRDAGATHTVDAQRRWATPGLVDCHTHARLRRQSRRRVRAQARRRDVRGNRRARAAASWRRCARRARRAMTDLAAGSATAARRDDRRRRDDSRDQVGLRPRHGNELKQLRVARALGAALDVDVRTTLLAAHALPPEYADRADAYIDYVCDETIPAAAREGARRRRRCVLRDDRLHAARRRVACSRRRARTGCRSSCTRTSCRTPTARASPRNSAHCRPITSSTRTTRASRRWRSAGTVAVLLPGAFYALRETRAAADRRAARASRSDRDLDRLQSRHVARDVAAADDEHGVHAVPPDAAARRWPASRATRRARSDSPTAVRSTVGQRADVALWNIDEPAELAYRIGAQAVRRRHPRRPFRAEPRLTCCSGTSTAAIRR